MLKLKVVLFSLYLVSPNLLKHVKSKIVSVVFLKI